MHSCENMARYHEDEKLKRVHDYVFLEPTVDLAGWPEVKGYDFEGKFNFWQFLKSYYHTGFQATSLYNAIVLIRQMRREKATIFLGYTSNMISCGVREQIKYLTKNKLVDVLVTTTGGLEEDIIKAKKPFVLGSYDADGGSLREKGINRTGNIFIPDDRYLFFESFMNGLLKRLYSIKKVWTIAEFVKEMGKELETLAKSDPEINPESSVTYWAYKNSIPYFVLPLVDGSVGDIIYFFKRTHPDFIIDETSVIVEINNIAMNAEKSGVIALGGSVPKHLVANANLFREGADYAVYITTAMEYEGSNAGANPDEAVSWGKFKAKRTTVKVYAEASLVFPLIVAGAFYLPLTESEFDFEEESQES